MANIIDMANSFVVTAPSPATSGTSITITTGTGAIFPTPPFYATVTPPGSLTTPGTSEIVLVTARPGAADTFTITRNQKTSAGAKSIATGWIFSNSIYTDDVLSAGIVFDELLTGTPNGSLTAFTTASAFSSIIVNKNGVTLHKTDDYTVSGNTITFLTAPATGTKLTATYVVGSSIMINGSNSLIDGETPSGTVNSSNTVFTTAQPYIAGSLQVHINGIKQKRITHYAETTPTTGTFTMGDAPLTGDIITVSYQYIVSVSGNADTVDGFHASSTPAASTILPLDSNARLPLAGTVRQNDTTNTVTAPRMETGWGVMTPGVASSANETVTFQTAFATAPIVVITWGGDATSATTYGSGSNVVKLFGGAKAVDITTSNFKAYVFSDGAGSQWAAGNTVFYQWIAIGV